MDLGWEMEERESKLLFGYYRIWALGLCRNGAGEGRVVEVLTMGGGDKEEDMQSRVDTRTQERDHRAEEGSSFHFLC